MVRFRRDVASLFGFIKASAILHQAQRRVDAQGRVVATLADYRVAYPIFSKVLAVTSGRGVTDAVRAVVDLVAKRAAPSAPKSTAGKFTRTGATTAGTGVVLSSQQIGILTGLGKSAAYRAVLSAIDLGFLANIETGVANRTDWWSGSPSTKPLPDCCRIRTRLCRKGAPIEPLGEQSAGSRLFQPVSRCFNAA
jgi:hypothetical protein